MRVQNRKNLKWKYPPKRDLMSLHIDYILDCKTDRQWNISNKTSTTFQLRNHIQITFLKEHIYFT